MANRPAMVDWNDDFHVGQWAERPEWWKFHCEGHVLSKHSALKPFWRHELVPSFGT